MSAGRPWLAGAMLPESPPRNSLLPNHRVGINQDDR